MFIFLEIRLDRYIKNGFSAKVRKSFFVVCNVSFKIVSVLDQNLGFNSILSCLIKALLFLSLKRIDVIFALPNRVSLISFLLQYSICNALFFKPLNFLS
jgi:hypothetical protein